MDGRPPPTRRYDPPVIDGALVHSPWSLLWGLATFSAGPFWIWQAWVGPMGEQPIFPTRRQATDATRWFLTAFGCFWMSFGLNQIVEGSWPWPLAILNGLVVTALVVSLLVGMARWRVHRRERRPLRRA